MLAQKPRNYRRAHVSCTPVCVGGYSSGFTGAMAGFFSSAERFLKAEQKEIRSAERREGEKRGERGRANEIKEIGVISAWYPGRRDVLVLIRPYSLATKMYPLTTKFHARSNFASLLTLSLRRLENSNGTIARSRVQTEISIEK